MGRAQQTERAPLNYQRARILSAMVAAASARGAESVTVSDITGLARVSRGTFYALFAGSEDCLRATIGEAVALAVARAGATYDPRVRWVDRVRAGLDALLELADEEPELARLTVAQALVGRAAHPRLDRALDQLVGILDEGRHAPGACEPPPHAAQSVLGGALGLIYARLISRDGRALLELRNPLMSTIALPYLGHDAARREQARRDPQRSTRQLTQERSGGPPEQPGIRITYRTMRVLAVIAAQSALSNNEIAERAGISDPGQMSKLLARLKRLGLIENTGAGQTGGAANAWRLTRTGRKLQRETARDPVYAMP